MVLVGPTACGKTEYAIAAAQAFDGEIVNADSMQIYQRMSIGSAKPTAAERAAAVHHLVDQIDPKQPFSVAEYQRLAKDAIRDILSRKRLPVVSGGTGLYVNSLLYQLDFGQAEGSRALRARLEQEAKEQGAAVLYRRLCEQDPEAASRIEEGNVRKVIRALELLETTGESLPDFQRSFRPAEEYRPVLIGLTRNREELVARIEARSARMFEQGLVEEVRSLLAEGLREEDISMKGIGYKEVIHYLNGAYDLAACKELVNIHSRQYAKRQMTWFKRLPGIQWINLSEHTSKETVIGQMRNALYESNG